LAADIVTDKTKQHITNVILRIIVFSSHFL